MRVGVNIFVTDQSIDPVALGEALETRGFESVFLAEHSHIPTSRATPWGGREGAPPLPEEYWRSLDTFVALSAIAATTDALLVGTGITLVAQHDPIWLAKQVASLDVLSSGRMLFGIGYGWNKEEMAQHGVSYLDRRARVADHIGLMKALWADDEASYQGEMVQLVPSWAWPKPVQDPHPPILLGGSAGPRTFAAMADYCDGWMPIVGRGEIGPKIEMLHECLEAAGRRPENFEISVFGARPDTSQWATWASLGITRVLVQLPPAPIEVVIPLLDEYRSLIEA